MASGRLWEVIDAAEDNSTPRNWRASIAPSGSTPGGPNSVQALGLPPWIASRSHPLEVLPGASIVVAADVIGASSVELIYRIDFSETEQTVEMLDGRC